MQTQQNKQEQVCESLYYDLVQQLAHDSFFSSSKNGGSKSIGLQKY